MNMCSGWQTSRATMSLSLCTLFQYMFQDEKLTNVLL